MISQRSIQVIGVLIILVAVIIKFRKPLIVEGKKLYKKVTKDTKTNDERGNTQMGKKKICINCGKAYDSTEWAECPHCAKREYEKRRKESRPINTAMDLFRE